MFKSLKTKLLVYFFIANITILICFSFFIYLTAQSGVENNLDSKLKILSQDAIVDLIEKNNFEAKIIAKDLSKEFGIKPLYLKIIYYDSVKNKIVHEHISSNNLKAVFDIPLHEKSNLNDIYYFDMDGFRVSSMFLNKKNNEKIFFQLATNKIIHSSYLQQLKLSLFIAIPIILVLFLFIVNLLISKTLKPMKKVVTSAKKISTNNLSARINHHDIPSEVQELVSTFNVLLENIEDAFTRISTFSSDASHELKTPLSVIRGEIEVILRKDRDTESYKSTLESILQETISIEESISQLFLLSKKDTVEFQGNVEEVYFDELISDVVDTHKKLSYKKKINIIVDELVPFTLEINESLLKIAISNILKNSIMYSDDGSEIHVSLRKENTNYILKISDNGYGITKNDLAFIFDRFYRVDKVRNRQKSGTGLGLSIVKMILDIYSFDIKVESELGVGTTTIIKLNMNKS